jgi:tetrahydrodipicolinate N-succinyltransferase
MGLYTKSEDELINQYGFDIPKQVEGKVPDGTGPKHNADWEAVKASYMPSPLKHVDMSLPADHSHDEEQVTEAVADPNYFMQVADEATSIEDMYAVTDEEKASISETAESTYSAYTQLEESYDNITDKDKTNESQLKEEYNKYLDNALGVKAGGSKRLSYEEWVQTKIDLVNSGAYNTMPERVTPAIQWAVDKGFEGLPSQIDANYNLNKNNYFNQKLTIAKRRWLKENNYDLDTPEGQAALEQLKDVTLAHIESDKVQATDAGGTSLSTVFNSIPNDDPEFKQAVVDTEARTERNAVIRGKAANIANELDKSGTAQEGASLWGGLLFDQSKEQVDLTEQAKTDLWNIEEAARKKSLEGDVLFQQYNASFDKITKTSNDLDKILPPEYKGDPVARIDDIKSQYDLTTREGVDAANKEITTFINAYEPLIKRYQEEHQTLQDLSLSVSQIRDELGDLSIREQDLDAFTNQIGKNHRLATQMANAFAQNTVDLAQGAADLVYMVNPLGALADER